MQTIKPNEQIPKNYTGVVEYNDGSKEWFKNGFYHREDGPAKEYANGSKEWYKEGLHHRLDGPAVEYSGGTKIWYKNGKRHRIDGPAIENPDGGKEWCVEDKMYIRIYLARFIATSVFLEKEIGKHDLFWYKFFTESGIEEFPIVPGMETDKRFKELFKMLEQKIAATIT